MICLWEGPKKLPIFGAISGLWRLPVAQLTAQDRPSTAWDSLSHFVALSIILLEPESNYRQPVSFNWKLKKTLIITNHELFFNQFHLLFPSNYNWIKNIIF